MSDFSKLKANKNGKEYILNVCTQDTEQDIIGTKNFTKLTVNSKNVVTSVNSVNADTSGNVDISFMPDYSAGVTLSSGSVVNFSGVIYMKISGKGSAAYGYVYINNVEVFGFDASGTGSCVQGSCAIISKGDTVTLTANGSLSIIAYPFK